MMFKKLLFINILVTSATLLHAQSKHSILLLNKEQNSPISGVTLIIDNKLAGKSNNQGLFSFELSNNKLPVQIVLFKEGFKPDTVLTRDIPDKLYMRPLEGTLKEAVITNKISERVLKSGSESVVDYAFVADKILIASFMGNKRKHGKLFLMNKYGDTIMMSSPVPAPEKIFRNCVGRYYLVSINAIHPITIDYEQNEILFDDPLSLKAYALLQSCELFIDNTYYYKIRDRSTFRVMFALADKGERNVRLLTKLEQPEVLYASIDHLMWALSQKDPRTRQKLLHLRAWFDRDFFRKIDVNLYAKADSLVIFNFDDREILFYTREGNYLGATPIQFYKTLVADPEIIQDEATGDFYFLEDNSMRTQITKIDLHTGAAASRPVVLEKRFADIVKIRDREVYYVWQGKHHVTNQLYVERNSIP